MEVQRGVTGDLSTIPELAVEARAVGLTGSIARLLAAGRSAGVRVVHCRASFDPALSLAAANAPLITAMLRRPGHLAKGTPAVELEPELGPEPGDLESDRSHGVSPFGLTSLDGLLRRNEVTTVVATGVSLNLGIPGLAIEAVNHGYSVVVPRDAVCGIPRDYAEMILENMLPLVATLTTTDELISCWT
jgi:nicotinamidase-related amidase